MGGAWQVGPITGTFNVGGEPTPFVIAGWVKGPFGLDFRVFADDEGDFVNPGYVLTHLPTGMIVRQLPFGSLTEAQALADEVLSSADWTFTGEPTEQCRVAIKDLIGKHGRGRLASGHSVLGPSL